MREEKKHTLQPWKPTLGSGGLAPCLKNRPPLGAKIDLHRIFGSGGLVSCLKNRPPLGTKIDLHRYLGLAFSRPLCLFRGCYEMGSHRRLTEGIEAPQKPLTPVKLV